MFCQFPFSKNETELDNYHEKPNERVASRDYNRVMV